MVETRTGPLPEVERACARWLAAALRAAIAAHGRAVFAIPGGRSVGGPLRALLDETVEWRSVEVVFADERHLPPGNPDRNDVADAPFTSALADRGLPARQVHPAPFVPDDPARSAMLYGRTLRRLGGRVHVILLGAGEDGHVASLFPGRPELSLTAPGITAVAGAPKPPPDRITMTPGLIVAAERACLLFLGIGKQEAYRLFSDPAVGESACPARLLLAVPQVLVVADEAAAGRQE